VVTIGSTIELRSQVSKTNKLVIKFANEASKHESLIQEIDGVISTQLQDNFVIELEVKDFNVITPIIVSTLVKQGASILEVRPTGKSLEDIYKQIMDASSGGLNHDAT